MWCLDLWKSSHPHNHKHTETNTHTHRSGFNTMQTPQRPTLTMKLQKIINVLNSLARLLRPPRKTYVFSHSLLLVLNRSNSFMEHPPFKPLWRLGYQYFVYDYDCLLACPMTLFLFLQALCCHLQYVQQWAFLQKQAVE